MTTTQTSTQNTEMTAADRAIARAFYLRANAEAEVRAASLRRADMARISSLERAERARRK